jgi:hypothetical protein
MMMVKISKNLNVEASTIHWPATLIPTKSQNFTFQNFKASDDFSLFPTFSKKLKT